jgi:hypothetical protein
MNKIYFGSTYDSATYPLSGPDNKDYMIGDQVLGPMGLLAHLELHLGLQQKMISETVRIEAYRQLLHKYLQENPNCFFADSFEIDAFGVARKILSMRDFLLKEGFDFISQKDMPDRISVLCEIEDDILIPIGYAERWYNALDELKHGDNQLDRCELMICEDQNHFDLPIRKSFDLLQQQGWEVKTWSVEVSKSAGDLGVLKRFLVEKESNLTFAGDGSVLYVECPNELQAADFAAKYCSQLEESKPILVIEDQGDLLAAALSKNGLPAILSAKSAKNNPLSELLKLIPQFIWEPLNPEGLLNFLLSKETPLNKSLSNKLAHCLAETPGVGHSKWKSVIDDYLDGYKEKYGPKDLKKEKEKLEFWLSTERYSVVDGVAISTVELFVSQLRKWALARLRLNESKETLANELSSGLLLLAQQAKSLLEVLDALKATQALINPEQLDLYISTVLKGSALWSIPSEEGALPQIGNPQNALSGVDQLLWWRFDGAANPLNVKQPLFKYEVKYLSKQGFEVDRSVENIQKYFNQQKWAILQTSKSILFIYSKTVNGEIAPVHPLWSDINSCINGSEKIVVQLESLGEIKEKRLQHLVSMVNRKDLPGLKAYWDITEKGLLQPREQESYSSLSTLFNYPHEYVLNYIARIREKPQLSAQIDSRMKGLLAHRIAEDLFNRTGVIDLNEEKFGAVFNEIAHDIIEKEFAVFLQPHNLITRDTFIAATKKSLFVLSQLIAQNDWEIESTETPHEANLGSIKVGGIVDLVLKRETERAIVDLKWGGLTKRTEEIKKEQELQLAIYSHLIAKSKSIIPCGYYIITNQAFICRNDEIFKDQAIYLENKNMEIAFGNIRRKAENSYRERWDEIHKGMIELGIEMTQDELESLRWDEEQFFLPKHEHKTRSGTRIKNKNSYSIYGLFTGENKTI